MGSNQSCQNLIPGPNYICNISQCTKKVVGIESTSASPSDIWILTLESGTKYGNMEITGDIVMKLFLSLTNTPMTMTPYYSLKGAQELTYESNVYEYLVDKILQNNMNPFFVQYYGRSLHCSFDNIKDILVGSAELEGYNKNMDDSEATLYLSRNTSYIGEQKEGRPSINNPDLDSYSRGQLNEFMNVIPNSGIKYGMILTKKSSGVVAYKWFNDHITKSGYYDRDAMLVIIQIISALVTLSKFEAMHNDLHLGNIFIENLPRPSTNLYTFEFQGNKYMYMMSNIYISRIYDWDKAYMKILGPNPLVVSLSEDFCIYNRYIPQMDIAKIIIGLMYPYKKKISREQRTQLLNMLYDDSKIQYRQYFDTNVLLDNDDRYFFKDKQTGKCISDEYFQNMVPIEECLYRYIQYVHSQNNNITDVFYPNTEWLNYAEQNSITIYNFSSVPKTFKTKTMQEL